MASTANLSVGELADAVFQGKVAIVSRCLESGVDVNSRNPLDGSTVLHYAAMANHANVIARLIAGGANVEAVDYRLRTPLMIAASGGNTAAIGALIDAGANLEALDENNRTALMRAALSGEVAPVRKLLDAYSNLEAEDADGNTALMYAVDCDHADVVRELLDGGANPDVVTVGDLERNPAAAAVLRARGVTGVGGLARAATPPPAE